MYRERRIPAGEAQRILARALELQRAEGGGRDLGDEELASAAAGLGVEPRFLEQAMAGDDAGASAPQGAGSWFVGAELRPTRERLVPRSIEPSDHRRVVEAIRRATGHEGNTEIIGNEISWSYTPPRQGQARPRLRVRVSPAEQGTTVRVESDLRVAAGGLFGGVLGGLGTNLLLWSILVPVVFHGPGFITPLLLGAIAMVYLILRTSFGAYARGRRDEVATILSKVAAEVGSPAAERVRVDARPAASAQHEEEPADAGEDDAGDDDASGAARRVTR